MQSYPDKRGHFGEFGGRYVAETLMPGARSSWKRRTDTARRDPAFRAELDALLARVRRPADAALTSPPI